MIPLFHSKIYNAPMLLRLYDAILMLLASSMYVLLNIFDHFNILKERRIKVLHFLKHQQVLYPKVSKVLFFVVYMYL